MGMLKARVSGAWVPISAGVPAAFPGVFIVQTVTATGQNVGTGGTNLTGLSVTFTAVAGAGYIVLGQAIVRQRTVGGLPRLAILASHPSPTTIGTCAMSIPVDDYGTLMVQSTVSTPGAVSVTYNLQGYTSGGTCDYQALGTNSVIQVFRVT